MGKYRKKSLNQQTIIKQYHIINNNNYYIKNGDINSNDINSDNKEKVLDNQKDNIQDKDSSSEETVNKKKDSFLNQLISYIPFIYSITMLFLYSNDNTKFSIILLLYSTSLTISMELDAWIQYHYIKTGKINLLYKINNFLKPVLYFLFLFMGITFLLKKFELLDKIKHINKITMLIMFASTISYGIRDIKTYKLQKLSKIENNK